MLKGIKTLIECPFVAIMTLKVFGPDLNILDPNHLSPPVTISGTGKQQDHLNILTSERKMNGTGSETLLPLILHFFLSVPTVTVSAFHHCKKCLMWRSYFYSL